MLAINMLICNLTVTGYTMFPYNHFVNDSSNLALLVGKHIVSQVKGESSFNLSKSYLTIDEL